MFLYCLNHAAKKVHVPFQKPSVDREARFIQALGDTKLKTTLQGQKFETLSELEATLKRVEALRRKEIRDSQQKRRPAPNVQFGQFKPPQRRVEGRAFVTDAVEVEPSQRRQSQFRDDYDRGYEAETREPELGSIEPTPKLHHGPLPILVQTQSMINDAEFRVAERRSGSVNPRLGGSPAQYAGERDTFRNTRRRSASGKNPLKVVRLMQ
jgi:hypothetical protein